jgi:hypothetical protein
MLDMSTSTQTQNPPRVYIGRPRDIDFIKDLWTQVVVQGGPTDDLVAKTANDGITRVVLVALTLKRDAAVEYVDEEPPRLTAATLELDPSDEEGRVWAISFREKDGYFRVATVQDGHPVEVWSTSEQVQSIVTTAVLGSIPLDVDFDPKSLEITRAKVNVVVEGG